MAIKANGTRTAFDLAAELARHRAEHPQPDDAEVVAETEPVADPKPVPKSKSGVESAK